MSEDNSQENGTANGDVPEIELIIKVRVLGFYSFAKCYFGVGKTIMQIKET